MYKLWLLLLLALTVSTISVQSHLRQGEDDSGEEEEEVKFGRGVLRKHFKDIGKAGAIEAICEYIDDIFEEYAAQSDDPDKDQLCEAEFTTFIEDTFGNVNANKISRIFNKIDTDDNDDICQAEFAAALGVNCDE